MFDSVLVPLDGSQLAECALPHATAFAGSFNAEVTLLRMLEKGQVNASAQLFDLLNWQIKKTQAGLYLEKTQARLQGSGVRVRTSVLEGLVAAGITEYAQNQGMKLTILSSHGRNGLTQWGVSSVTQKIIMSAPTSVLIVRAHPSMANPDGLPDNPLYERILVPLDGSQRAENVLPVITQLAHFHKSIIYLVQVIQTPEMARQMPPSPDDIELSSRVIARNREEAGRYLEQLKSRSTLEGVAIQTHLISSDNAAASLHQIVEQEHINMVALSAHGFSGNLNWPYGSMVNNFFMYGTVPLLVVQDLPAKLEQAPVEMPIGERAER
jgi:nucleotide-binding universal stress UspA family protein